MPARTDARTHIRTDVRLECPACQGPLARVRRLAHEKSEQHKGDMRRYRCVASACDWQGLLPRRVRRPRRLLLRRIARGVQRGLLPAAALAGFGVTVAAVAWQAGLMTPTLRRGYALGEHHDGEKLPAAHPLSRHHARAERVAVALNGPSLAAATAPATDGATLQLRYGCVWGKPGRNPYKGSVEQALRSAALPDEVVKAIAAQVRAGQAVDRLEIRNDGVHALASGRDFSAQNMAMTYGQTLCLGTRVNFKAGHMEPAALYEATTADGRIVAVMVPEVCGNVSVLGQSDESARALRLASVSSGNQETTIARWMPAVLDGAGGALVGSDSQDIPEPGTLACVMAALAAWGLACWRRARKS